MAAIKRECNGLAHTATASCFYDGRLAELFLNNHKSNSTADENARDAAIAVSLALQNGVIRSLWQGRASGALGQALDFIAGDGQ
jgi:hypothetical protein